MAAFAVVEVRLAEGALAVVAGHAALCARVGEMLRRKSRADLASLRQPAPGDGVATVAVETLARAVIGVAEAYPVGTSVGAGWRVAARRVTCPAG